MPLVSVTVTATVAENKDHRGRESRTLWVLKNITFQFNYVENIKARQLH